MIFEIADIEVAPEARAEFEAAVAEAAQYFREAPDCHSFRLERSVDHAGKFRLVMGWESVAAHMVGFRESEGFQRWRALAGPFFIKPPVVDHTEIAIEGF